MRLFVDNGPRLTPSQEDADPLESFFELNDTLYAKASISQTEEVYLWLGVCSLMATLALFDYLSYLDLI